MGMFYLRSNKNTCNIKGVGRQKARCIFIAGLFFLGVTAPGPARAQTGVQFWSYWGDGKAEVNSYSVSVPRYGQQREGYDVLIFVTEDFDRREHVKVETKTPASVPVLKLNHVRRFQTGMYDYAMMLSVFSPVTLRGSGRREARSVTPLKTSLTVNEWCGNYFEQMNTRPDGFHRHFYSYFEAEGDGHGVLPYHRDIIFEDDLLIRMRELNSAFPAGSYTIITSSFYGRLQGFEPAIEKAQVQRLVLPEQHTAFGTAPVIRYTISFVPAGRTLSADILGTQARQILRWSRTFKAKGDVLTESAELISSERSAYWKLQGAQGRKQRRQLGIPEILTKAAEQ